MTRKVLFYTYAFGGGGAEIVFARLAGAFADAGDEVILVADGPVLRPADRANLRHVILPRGHAQAVIRLAALLRTEKPTISFSALGAQNIKHLAAAMLAGRRTRCVLGYHGFAEAERKLLSRLSFVLASILTRCAAQTICVSDVLLDSMRRRWHASPAHTMRIYNPVATVTVAPTPDQPPLVLACGRLVASKRFDDLVTAFASVEPHTARLAILGEGPERARIEAAIQRFDLGDRVTLAGHVDDPSAWYRRASCLAIASETESFGLTAAEALSHGLPVVSTDCSGPREILKDGRFGTLVPIGDTVALAQALTHALSAPGDPAPRRTRAEAFALDTIRDAYAALADRLGR